MDFTVTLFIQHCGPVEDHRHRLALSVFEWREDQKALAVTGHIIDELVPARNLLPRSNLKKWDRHTGIKLCSGRDRDRHHFAVRRKEE
jgi:hypothetical protein